MEKGNPLVTISLWDREAEARENFIGHVCSMHVRGRGAACAGMNEETYADIISHLIFHSHTLAHTCASTCLIHASISRWIDDTNLLSFPRTRTHAQQTSSSQASITADDMCWGLSDLKTMQLCNTLTNFFFFLLSQLTSPSTSHQGQHHINVIITHHHHRPSPISIATSPILSLDLFPGVRREAKRVPTQNRFGE